MKALLPRWKTTSKIVVFKSGFMTQHGYTTQRSW